MKRRRFKQQVPLQDRLASFAKTAREVAALLPPGQKKTNCSARRPGPIRRTG